MKAVYASTVNHDDPLAALAVGEQPEPQARPFWSTVSVRAVTVNHHDVWSLQGVGLAAEQTPMIREIPRHDGREDCRAVRQRVRQARKPHHG